MKREMRARVHNLAPSVHIGKAGLTQGIIEETKRKLKKEKILKVKFLASAVAGGGKKALMNELAEKSGSSIVHAVGFVVTLSRGLKGGKSQKKELQEQKII
jgi:RNA-binding protein